MSTITYPSTRLFDPASFDFWLVESVRTSRSLLSGSVQTIALPGAKWNAIVTLRGGTPAEAAGREAWIASIRGGINLVSMWHLQRPEPRGTMRGSPTVATTAPAGATSIAITGTGTLAAGDMLGINGQLVMITAWSTGFIDVVPALRQQATAGTAIVWSKPSALFRLTSPVQSRYEPMWSPGPSLQLEEFI